MTVIRKAVQRTVRLDDDVWEAVKAMPCSLNQYLRTTLLSHPRTVKSMIMRAASGITAQRKPRPSEKRIK